MSEPQVVEEIGAVAEALPHMPVLNYIAQVTVTRARRIGFWAVVVAAVIFLVVAGYFLLEMWAEMGAYARSAAYWRVRGLGPAVFPLPAVWPPVVTWRDYLSGARTMFFGSARWLVCSIFCLPGPMLTIVMWGVRRGRHFECTVAGATFGVFAAAAGVVTAIYCGSGLIYGFGWLARGGAEPEQLAWMLLLLPGAVVAVLLKDVAALLWWVARNPAQEKPAVAFLPK